MSLLNQLSELDLKRFENFVDLYGVNRFNYCGNERYLRFWDKNKRDLFKLLGNQLIYETPYEFESKYAYADTLDFIGEKENVQFFADLKAAAYENGCPVEATRFITRQHNICKNVIDWFTEVTLDTMEDKKPVKISEYMRYTKALAKFIEYYDLHDFKKKFEEYRIRHSMLLASFKVKGVLCLSIHPLDFITMSDNANSWTSCMSWVDKGCYRAGTVEMMNSKYAIVAYLKTDSKVYNFKEDTRSEDYQWNSKQYRQLFFVGEDFLLAGKSYPYSSREITNSIFNLLKELAENNCEYHYNYEDTYEWFDWDTKFITNTMYNDILNDNDRVYPIAYNFCDADCLEYNLSGEAPCLVCGDLHMLVEDYYYELDDGAETCYNSRFKHTEAVYCRDCGKIIHCSHCGSAATESNSLALVDGEAVCKDCWESFVRVDPITGEIFKIQGHLLDEYISDYAAYLILDSGNPLADDSFIFIKGGKKVVPILAAPETLSKLDKDGELIYKDVTKVHSFEYRILTPRPNSTIDWTKFLYRNLVTPEFIGI